MPIALLKRISTIILIAGSITLIAWHLFTHQNDFRQITRIDIRDQFALVLIYLSIHFLSALKIFFLLRKMDLKQLKYWAWFKIFTVSRFANLHVTQGANIYRSVKLKHEYGFSYARSVGLVTIFTWLECLVMFILTAGILSLHPLRSSTFPESLSGKDHFLLILTVTTIVVGILPWFMRAIIRKLTFPHKTLDQLRSQLNEMLGIFTHCLKDHKLILAVCAVSLVSFALNLSWVFTAFQAIGEDVNLGFLTVFSLIIFLSKTFNIVPGNLGLRELACGFLGKSAGWGMTEGIMVSALTRVVEYVVITVLGIIFARTIFIRKKIVSD